MKGSSNSGPSSGSWSNRWIEASRDGSLNVNFEAAPGEQMWRPARVTSRPKAQGLHPAKIHQGVPIAQLDEAGQDLAPHQAQDCLTGSKLQIAVKEDALCDARGRAVTKWQPPGDRR